MKVIKEKIWLMAMQHFPFHGLHRYLCS